MLEHQSRPLSAESTIESKHKSARFSLQNSQGNTCEFGEISKNTYFTEYFWATASLSGIDLDSHSYFASSH